MDDDRRAAIAGTFQVGEVAQGELKEMHPVDEGKIDRASLQDGPEIVLAEELVAGELEDLG